MTGQKTKVLQIRINPGGRTMRLHPRDHDLETYLETHGGQATVKLIWLLSREHKTSSKGVREYNKVVD